MKVNIHRLLKEAKDAVPQQRYQTHKHGKE